VAGSEESLGSSVAFLFTVGVCCEAVVPRFRVGTAGRFFLLLIAYLPLHTHQYSRNGPIPDAPLPHWPCHPGHGIHKYHAPFSPFTFFIKPLKMDLTEGSETSAQLILTPGKYPKESIQYSEHGENLKS
jgi:hypothetical protein